MFILYQYLIALPILVVITLLTCLITFVFAPWKNSAIPHAAQVLWARSVYRLLFISIQVDGLEHLQKGESYVFACNHQSFLDVFAIYGWLPVVFKWLMKKELRKIPVVGWACVAAGHVFIDRSNPQAAYESLQQVKRELQDGVSTVIFPEGTRTHTGQVGVFKKGAFRIAQDLDMRIVPLSLTGCFEAMSRTSWWVRPHSHVRMYVGEPIDMKDFVSTSDAITYVRERVLEGMQKN